MWNNRPSQPDQYRSEFTADDTLSQESSEEFFDCSYIRNEDSYGTEMPWYLYDNHIDSGKVYFAMLEAWKVTEFLGESDSLHVEDTGSPAYAREQKLTQNLVDTYIGQEINMSWDRKKHDVKSFQSASEYGYYYTSWENLYKVYGQPETLAMEASFSCATLQAHDFEEEIDIIVDQNGKAVICVEGRFFLLEPSEEKCLKRNAMMISPAY